MHSTVSQHPVHIDASSLLFFYIHIRMMASELEYFNNSLTSLMAPKNGSKYDNALYLRREREWGEWRLVSIMCT